MRILNYTNRRYGRVGIVTAVFFLLASFMLQAQAADVIVSSPFPTVFYNDTDVTAQTTEWQTNVDQTSFVIYDDVFNQTVLRFQGTANNANSLLVDGAGDISLADGSLFIDKSANRLGIGTTTPTHNLHIASVFGDLRLEDTDGTSFIMNCDGLSGTFTLCMDSDDNGTADTTPLSISVSAPDDAIHVDSAGNIGVGLATPTAPVHVRRDGGGTDVVVMNLQNNNGKARFLLSSAANAWTFDAGVTDFNFSKVGTGVNEMALDGSGNMTIQGTLTQGSSRSFKEDIVAMDENMVLAKLDNLELAEWQYKNNKARHFGPMAEDFHAAFKLGKDDKHIAPGDMAGVALAASKALVKKNAELQARVQDLEAQVQANAGLKSELQELRKMIQKLQARDSVALVH